MPAGSQRKANEEIRAEREKATIIKCAWPMGLTPKRNLVRRCGAPAAYLTGVSKIAVCGLHKTDTCVPLWQALSDTKEIFR